MFVHNLIDQACGANGNVELAHYAFRVIDELGVEMTGSVASGFRFGRHFARKPRTVWYLEAGRR